MTLDERVFEIVDNMSAQWPVHQMEILKEALIEFGQELIDKIHSAHAKVGGRSESEDRLRRWYNTGMTDAEVIIWEHLK